MDHVHETFFKIIIVHILFSLSLDLREGDAKYTSRGTRLVTREDGTALAKKLGVKFCETSALTQQGLKTCFDEAVSNNLM